MGLQPVGKAMSIKHLERASVPDGHPVAIFARFWDSLRAGRETPEWRRFDPVDCPPKVLPWILLLVPDGEGGLKYSISGTGCDEVFNLRYQGKTFGEGLPEQAYRDRRAEFDKVVGARAPLYSLVQLPVEDREFIKVYRGVFPFLSDGADIDAMMVIIAPVKT